MAYSYFNHGGNEHASTNYSLHSFLVIPPLLVILLFCFGFISASKNNRAEARRADVVSPTPQSELTPAVKLPVLPSSPDSAPTTNSQPAAPQAGGRNMPTAQNLQSAASGNPAPAATVPGQALINGVKIVTDSLNPGLPL